MMPADVIGHLLIVTGFAPNMAARFCAPVYLVGSALEKGSDARDVDVRVVLDDDQFQARYETSPSKWPSSQRWVDDCAKLGAQAVAMTRLNVDFQIISRTWQDLKYSEQPRIELASPSAEILQECGR
jgi:hypothetical protein